MGSRTIVTFGSDGFRDYVTLPEGPTYNLGSISVLQFVASLAPSQDEAKKALDGFLQDRKASLSVDADELLRLLTPRRARWAGGKTLVASDQRTPPGDETSMDSRRLAAVTQGIAELEERIQFLEGYGGGKVATEFSKGLVARAFEDALAVSERLVQAAESQDEPEEDSPPAEEPEESDKTAGSSEDQLAIRELELFIDNESNLLRTKEAVLKKVLQRMKQGNVDPAKTVDLWGNLVDEGVKAFARENSIDVSAMFPPALRKMLAKEYADYYAQGIKNGEYDHIKVAAQEADEGDEGQQKEASEDLSSAHEVLAKVYRGIEAVSKFDGLPVTRAAADLRRIAGDLRAAFAEPLEGSERTSRVASLSAKADHVLRHFGG